MKVALINTLYPPLAVGGAERVVRALARGLVQQGDDVTVLTLSPERTASVQHEEGVKVMRLPLQNIYWPFGGQPSAAQRLVWHGVDSYNIAAARTVGRVLEEELPDVVHTHNLAGFSGLAWRAAKALRLPLVHTLHDYYLLCPRSTMYKGEGNCDSPCTTCALLSAPRRATSKLVDTVVSVSSFLLRRHEECGLFSGNATRHVIHNCMTHDQPSDSTSRQSERPSTDVLRLGYIGRIERVKGIESLLEATAALAPGSWQLYIAGEGDTAYVSGLKAKFPSNDITYLGHSALSDFFRQIDLLVVPSVWNEPLGMVAFEAYFFGVPVVASCKGGLPEIVTDAEGVLFDPDSPPALAAVLSALQAEPQRLARLAAGASRAAARFEPARMSGAYRSIYKNAVATQTETRASRV